MSGRSQRLIGAGGARARRVRRGTTSPGVTQLEHIGARIELSDDIGAGFTTYITSVTEPFKSGIPARSTRISRRAKLAASPYSQGNRSRSVLQALGLVLDELGVVDSDQLSSSELRDGRSELKSFESRLTGQLARLTHDADRRSAFVGTGARDTAEWLGKQTGTSARKNRSAADLGAAMAKSDELAAAIAS